MSASKGRSLGESSRSSSVGLPVKSMVPETAVFASHFAYVFASQTVPQTASAPMVSSSQSKKVTLPDGSGKSLAIQYCQDCHSLANLTSARKQPEQWRKTVMTMLDRGARLPPDKVDVLVEYLARNFAPAQAAPRAGASGPAAPAASDATPASSGPQTAALPDGPGKTVAMQYCQSCHPMTLVTKARKSASQWRQSVQEMVYFGSTLPKQDIDPLVQYLAKNFGPEK